MISFINYLIIIKINLIKKFKNKINNHELNINNSSLRMLYCFLESYLVTLICMFFFIIL